MISTALAIQDAVGSAVTDIETMTMAKSIFRNHNTMTDEEMSHALFLYSAHLSSLVATMVTHICLTEAQMTEMIKTIKEFDAIEQEIKNG